MSINFAHPNNPNPSRLIESLRHLGYDNYVAIADIVDNSIDAEAKNVKVKIFDILGHHVKTIHDRIFTAGDYTIIWDGTNDISAEVATGLYFVAVSVNNVQTIRKVILLK